MSESNATNSTSIEDKKIEDPKPVDVPEQTPEQKKEIDDLVKSIMENQKNLTTLNTELCSNNDKRLSVKKTLRESKRIQTTFQQVYQTPLFQYEAKKCKIDRHILMLKIMYCSQVLKEQKEMLEKKRIVAKPITPPKTETIEVVEEPKQKQHSPITSRPPKTNKK